eukprot:2328055-Rhodomonas_salina.2
MSGTEIAYGRVPPGGVMERSMSDIRSLYPTPPYAMSGTEIAYGDPPTPPYAMSGTEIPYGLCRCYAMSGTEIAYGVGDQRREHPESHADCP